MAAANGRIGISLCPGKQHADAWTGPTARDLCADLDVIRVWGAAVVVTLIEPHEVTALGVERLGDEVSARGMRWLHLPIRDVTAPGATFEQAWQEAGPTLRQLLESGESVFIHCKGGLGRAGTVAARLLIELGDEVETAMAKVREVRPGAIDVPVQEDYLRTLGSAVDL